MSFGFCSWKRLGIFLFPMDGMLIHRRITPSIKLAGNHWSTWVERGTVDTVSKVSCPGTQTGLEPAPLDLEPSAPTMRPPCLPLSIRIVYKIKPPLVPRAGDYFATISTTVPDPPKLLFIHSKFL